MKAPTLVLDDGTILMDATLILHYLERTAPDYVQLSPSDVQDFVTAQRLIGLALLACEKTMHIVYEKRCAQAKSSISHGLIALCDSCWPLIRFFKLALAT